MIRVSCNALCRIYDPQRGFLLALNRNRMTQGKRIMMPLGGSLQCYIPRQMERLGIEWDSGETLEVQDLRFIMPEENLDRFRMWFLSREGREESPLRELREELVDEIGVLDHLADEDVNAEYAFLREDERISDRENIRVALTHYFNEIFDVTFSAPVLEKINAFTLHSDELRWISSSLVQRGYVDEQTTITTVF